MKRTQEEVIAIVEADINNWPDNDWGIYISDAVIDCYDDDDVRNLFEQYENYGVDPQYLCNQLDDFRKSVVGDKGLLSEEEFDEYEDEISEMLESATNEACEKFIANYLFDDED